MKILVCLGIVLLVGCSFLGLQPPPSVCDTAPADSLICKVCIEMGTTPEVADLLLESAALRVVDDKDVNKVIKFYEDVEGILTHPITYTALINHVQSYVEFTGPELMLISMYLPAFTSPQPISPYDKNLLLIHCHRMIDEISRR